MHTKNPAIDLAISTLRSHVATDTDKGLAEEIIRHETRPFVVGLTASCFEPKSQVAAELEALREA